ncbi:unnamed protein product [Bursaphelenchus xylophilus]|uniref:(pine wood nematode) hypothetical protein n=1 Tax=Bursaphelenchus xylophilus TaxID=6326 RepID=A0A1I7S4Q4_BURXY|nr:unnamed protein product [Bursaphelenchus xylophilus]CAG9117299.1 unnamed protein product [Bursaphelenchus xylophilus]
MEVYLFEPEKYNLLYNCSFYDWNIIPREERRHRFLAVILLFFYFATISLYVPCLAAMMSSENRRRSSYQLMFLLGCMHICGLQTCGLMTGIHGYYGHVFCDFPREMYFFGSMGVSMWCASTMTSLFLGINRCVELLSVYWADVLFGGYCKLFWIITPIAYFFMFFFFTPSAFFNGQMMTWFFNPHYGYYEDVDLRYESFFHSVNNLFVIVAHSGVYVLFFFIYIRRTRMAQTEKKLRDNSTYIQILLLGLIHLIAAISYVVIQYLPVNFYSTLVASAAYLGSHGMPPLIYICCNKTIRMWIQRKIFGLHQKIGNSAEFSKFRSHRVSSEGATNLH